jgi:glycosyltransferase involved in cell wall biosynthesis
MEVTPARKILFVITKANWGGAQRYVFDVATAAKNKGFTAVVAYGEPGLLVDRLKNAGVRTLPVPSLKRDVSLFGEFRALSGLYRLFKTESPDVVHLNSSKAGFTGALAARLARVPRIIFTAHGWAFTEPRGAFARSVFEWLQYFTVRLSTKTIAVSNYVGDVAKKWRLPQGRLEVIRLGITEPEYLTRDTARAELIKIDPSLAPASGALWVGTIAELHRNKGLDIGVEGWKQVQLAAEWVIMGGGEEEKDLKTRAKEVPGIHFLGFVPDAAKYLKAFDLFLLPSRTEALAYVLLEAGTASLPVLTSGVGGTREAVGPEYPTTGFFKTEHPENLSEALGALTRDRQNLQKIGQDLALYVREHFSLEEMLTKTLAFYE